MGKETQNLVKVWFDKWEDGDFLNLPVSEKFKHTSPFGTTEGKENYISLVQENKDKFLGYSFEIHDEIYSEKKACVRYTAKQGDFALNVSEWYYINNDLIEEIIAHYHIGEIREDRKLDNPSKV
ncbi:MAG: nuclear transport factor 2 family protein [Calditrichaeota bacterium]|nr:MAG: nuclear transport factor 2 family protein [Calditrichota bacterium]MBL1205942.1 nuclear transport factor 2 family protein [Calditrichota bacterium]NOG45770.1 nuclear transport factor 2 family protein [Calditrichota bacterium]